MDNLHELLKQLRHQDPKDPEALSDIGIRICAYQDEVQWQCTVKPTNALLTWGVAVGPDPEAVLIKALHISLRGEAARRTESQATFHASREKAKGVLDLLLEEYEDDIAHGKVEFEPYKGWVVVLFPRPDRDLSFLIPRVEVRDGSVFPTAPVETSASKPQASSTTTLPASAAGKSKDDLEREYKALFGKSPNRNIKKADLAVIVEQERAKRG